MNPFIQFSKISDLEKTHTVDKRIVWNLSANELIDLAKDNPRTFIFCFVTGSVDEMNDYRGLLDAELFYITKRIATPMYIGNMEEPEKVAEYLVEQWADTSKLWGC